MNIFRLTGHVSSACQDNPTASITCCRVEIVHISYHIFSKHDDWNVDLDRKAILFCVLLILIPALLSTFRAHRSNTSGECWLRVAAILSKKLWSIITRRPCFSDNRRHHRRSRCLLSVSHLTQQQQL